MTEGVAACTEEEFISLWIEHQSATKVAKILNLDKRSVFARRFGIEQRRGITLPVLDARRPQYNKMLITADRVEVKLNLPDGIILVISDQHFWPGIVPTMHRAFCQMAKKLKPFATIWNGDSFDGSSISRFQSIGWEKKPSVSQELEAVKDRSREVINASPNSLRIWTAGNHDLRMESRLANVAPEFANMHGVHLKDHIPEWTPAWFITVNEGTPGHTEIRHREKGGIHAGYRNTLESGVNIVTGHDHRADIVPYNDRRGRRYSVRAGMGADSPRDPQFVHYLEGKSGNWQSAFAVLTYKHGALLCPELALRVSDDSYEFRGEVISC
jgi:hypothetical protein